MMPMDDPGNFPFYNGSNFEGFPVSQNSYNPAFYPPNGSGGISDQQELGNLTRMNPSNGSFSKASYNEKLPQGFSPVNEDESARASNTSINPRFSLPQINVSPSVVLASPFNPVINEIRDREPNYLKKIELSPLEQQLSNRDLIQSIYMRANDQIEYMRDKVIIDADPILTAGNISTGASKLPETEKKVDFE